MSNRFPRRLSWLLWFLSLLFLLALCAYPLSTASTRASEIALLALVYFWLIGLVWKQVAFRFALTGLALFSGVFLCLPAKSGTDRAALRTEFVASIQRYRGIPFYWGGESFKGVDCSGLVRRGMIDALFLRGFKSFDPGLVREGFSMWWNDTTAEEFGKGKPGLTQQLFKTKNLNELDDSKLLPGDLAVTIPGVHIMTFLGNHLWIEADPGEHRVTTLTAPIPHNTWLLSPMQIVRWRVLEP
jgi:hypothetical protein